MVAQNVTVDQSKSLTSLRIVPGDNNERDPVAPPSIYNNREETISFSSVASNCSDTDLINQQDQHDLQMMMLQSSMAQRLFYLKSFIMNLQNSGASVDKIAKILLTAECWLSDIILLQNVALTKNFLMEKESKHNGDSQSFVPPEVVLMRNLRLKSAFPTFEHSNIDDDSRTSVDLVMTSLDVKNAEVILRYGPDKGDRIRHFFRNLETMATKHLDLKTLNVFVEQAIKWNIIDDEASRLIELEVLQKANVEAIEVFLRHRINVQVKKLYQRNLLPALFGNPNASLGFLKKLKFDVNSRGTKDFTALHYAVQNSLIDKVKFLLDCGAEPNSMNWRNETPLVLALQKPQVQSIDSKKCVELLLQYGADPFLTSWEGQSFDSCIQSTYASSSRYLMELALAYARVHKAAGSANLSANNYNALKGIDIVVKENDHLFAFYMKCKQQLRSLKVDRVRRDLSMFEILSKTGDKFVHLLDENDRRIITGFIVKYSKENALHPYYLNALREHMRQYRKLVTYKNRAILILSQSFKAVAHCHVVLNKIISYLTCKDWLVFQLGFDKLPPTTPSCSRAVSRGMMCT